MKNHEFTQFKTVIEQEPYKSPFWYRGYLFLDLTTKQVNTVYRILETRNFPKDDQNCIELISGIRLSLSK